LHTVEKRLQLLDREHAYSSQIEIRNLERDRSRGRYSGLPAEGIFGEVKNLGDKSVVKLVLRFELLDAAGKPVAEEEWTPGFVDAGGGPLRPHFTRPFGLAVDRPPSDWVGVRASVKLARLSREGAELPTEK